MKRLSGGDAGFKMSWKSVTVQDTKVIYRLFIQWRPRGKIHVRLLCETNQSSCVVKRKLPVPNRMYVGVVLVKEVPEFQAGNIRSYPTQQVLIPEIGNLPTKPGTR